MSTPDPDPFNSWFTRIGRPVPVVLIAMRKGSGVARVERIVAGLDCILIEGVFGLRGVLEYRGCRLMGRE